jgi:hypothetical protein
MQITYPGGGQTKTNATLAVGAMGKHREETRNTWFECSSTCVFVLLPSWLLMHTVFYNEGEKKG